MKSRHKWIQYWDDERNIGNSLIVTLIPGRRFTEVSEHVRGFDSIKEAMIAVRDSVECTCKDCRESS